MLNNLITGQYADYQEYPFPFTIFSDSDGGLNKDALYYLDCGNGTLFQIIGDKRATKSQDGETAKGHEIPQLCKRRFSRMRGMPLHTVKLVLLFQL